MLPKLPLFFRLSIFCLFLNSTLFGQVQTARHVTINPYVKGFYEYLPEGYNSGSGSYPLIIFFHGAGERGDGSPGQLPRILNNGIPKMISKGTFPKSFTSNGQTHKFIVISPQFVDVPAWNQNSYVNDVIDYAVKNYRVDASRIYLTGLSMGGGMIFYYFQQNKKYTDRIAAIVPICEAYGFNDATAKIIADSKVSTWLTHNKGDNVINYIPSIQYEAAINKYSPGLAKATIFNVNGHDAWTQTYDPNFRENGKNVFEWMLQYKKGTVVTPPANKVPVVNAGADKTLTLPQSSVTLDGSGSDPDGSIASFAWSKVSGPTQFTLSNAGIAAPTVSNLVEGTYVFRVTVKDNSGASASDDVSVFVKQAANALPIVDAGANQIITLPTNSVSLRGTASDKDGSVTSYSWTKISGPTQFSLTNANAVNASVANMVAGTYVFRLTVKDNLGATASDDVSVNVNAAASNNAPTANAGSDKNLTLPVNSTNLSGSGADSDGTISKYSWSKISGPSQFTLSSSTVANPTLSNLAAGTYVFRLTVTDNKGATGTDDLSIIVSAPATPPPSSIVSDRVLIDFGPSYSTTSLDQWGKYWNNVTTALPGVRLTNAKNTKNAVTGIGFEVRNRIDGTFGLSGNGLNGGNVVGNVGEYPASATSDFAFAHYTATNGRWRLFGLDPKKQYTIKFWGTKSASSEYIVQIKRTDEATWKEYNAANNTNPSTGASFTFSGKSEMEFDIKTKSSNYLIGFGYVSLIDITSSAPGSTDGSTANTEKPSAPTPVADPVSILSVSPNPTTSNLVLGINNNYTGKLLVQVVNARTGNIYNTVNATKSTSGRMAVTLNVSSLPIGAYLVRVWFGFNAETVPFIKE